MIILPHLKWENYKPEPQHPNHILKLIPYHINIIKTLAWQNLNNPHQTIFSSTLLNYINIPNKVVVRMTEVVIMKHFELLGGKEPKRIK